MNYETINEEAENPQLSRYVCKTCAKRHTSRCPYSSFRNQLGCRRYYDPEMGDQGDGFDPRIESKDVFELLAYYYGSDYLRVLGLVLD